MKLLLINTPINIPDTLGNFSPIYNDMKMIPTGIAYLAAFVRNAGVEVRILDQFAESLPMDSIVRYIEEFSPDLIGYSATTPNFAAAIQFSKEIKNKFPQIPSVMGGYHPSVCPEQTLSCESVDFVIRDEGEHTLLALCVALSSRTKNYDNIPNLSFKTTVGQKHNDKALNVDVNELLFPAYDLLPMHMYSSPSYTKFASPVYQMLASRGCPYSCKYCINAESNVAAKYRMRHIASVLDEMEYLVLEYNAKQIQFWIRFFHLGKDTRLNSARNFVNAVSTKKSYGILPLVQNFWIKKR